MRISKGAPIPNTYPYPARGTEPTPEVREAVYALECQEWARKLSETNLRSLAVEYATGSRTPEAIDAHYEFQRRQSLGLLANQRTSESSPKSRGSRKGDQSRAKSKRSRD